MRQQPAAMVLSGMLLAQEPPEQPGYHQKGHLHLEEMYAHIHSQIYIYNLNLTKPIQVIFKVKFRLKYISTATTEVFYLAQI